MSLIEITQRLEAFCDHYNLGRKKADIRMLGMFYWVLGLEPEIRISPRIRPMLPGDLGVIVTEQRS